MRFSKPINGKDEELWVVAGDLPSAYLVVENIPTLAKAIQAYCQLMEDWANAVLQEQSLAGIFPVKAEPTEENARLLLSRVQFLRKNIIPLLESESK